MANKVEKDLSAAASFFAALGGGIIPPEVQQGIDMAREKFGGNRAPDPFEHEPSERATRPDSPAAKAPAPGKVQDLVPCPGCGTFLLKGHECGTCETPPKAPGAAPARVFQCVYGPNGVFVEQYLSAKEACDHAFEIGGFVRPLNAKDVPSK